ncbi:MAG TPA: MBL fold metallo-hydrolase [Pyrinomonadaceae bacterium]|nr:MBL fold metallo-hydrolase [Pyrinomonadaceae bacterium]
MSRLFAIALTFCLAAATQGRPVSRADVAGETSAGESSAETDERARRLVADALDALGGASRLEAITSVLVKTEGRENSAAIAQGYKPEGEGKSAAHEESIVAYPAQERFLYELKTARGDGTYRWRRWAYTGDERTVVDFVERFAAARRAESNRAERLRRARRVPHLLLLEASKNADALGPATTAEFDGRRHDVVSFRLPGEKTSVRLFLDAETHLLSKYDYTMDFPPYGDTMVELVYAPYRRHERLGWFPTGDAVRVGGKTYRQVSYSAVEVDSPRAAAQFELPEDLRAHVAAPGSVTEIARGVFLVNSLGNLSPVFVEFKDFVLAVEAPTHYFSLDTVPADPQQPGASSTSEEFIRKIKETVPGKPIRYLVVTHTHSDHAGGARAFIAEGATVLTTTGNRAFFERMASATHTVAPDRLAREPRPLKLETFDGRRSVTDGERTVELINTGPNPHTEENIVVHLPRERILYQGDLFYFDGESSFPPRSRTTVMPFFARWLVKNNLAPERIYGAHDRGFATMEHIRRVLALAP